jgi:hypothetical protein
MQNEATLLRGADVDASYKTGQLPKYKGNPLIEGLQPILPFEKVVRRLTKEIRFRKSERNKNDSIRGHCVFELIRFIEPSENHFKLEHALSILIRDSYVDRNPLSVNGARILSEGAGNVLKSFNSQSVYLPDTYKTSGGGVAMIGVSGMGKSTSMNNVLMSMYPAQIIRHGQYKGKSLNFTQIVWMKLECPPNGSTKGLCLNFFQKLDEILGNTKYYETYKKSRASSVELIPEMAQLCATYRIGVIIIDEIQHLCQANIGGQEEMLNYFVTLKNSIGIPIGLIGTWKAWAMLNTEFRQTRRTIEHFGLIQWDRMKFGFTDCEWSVFLNGIWRYQWTRNPVELDEALCQAMYDFSQGITDIAVKLFMMAQWRAILDKSEKITPELLKSVSDTELRAFKPVIEAIRLNDPSLLENAMDLFLTEMNMEQIYETVKMQMARKNKTSQQKNAAAAEEDPIEKAKETTRWLVEAGVPSQQADQIIRTMMEANNKLSLPELKNESFQAYQKAKIKLERRLKNKPNVCQKQDKSGAKTSIDLSGDIVPIA